MDLGPPCHRVVPLDRPGSVGAGRARPGSPPRLDRQGTVRGTGPGRPVHVVPRPGGGGPFDVPRRATVVPTAERLSAESDRLLLARVRRERGAPDLFRGPWRPGR